MRNALTGLIMVAAAIASFAMGRVNSGPSLAASPRSESVSSIDILHLQAMRRDLPEVRVDSPY